MTVFPKFFPLINLLIPSLIIDCRIQPAQN
jgi:hypothetical protein